MHAEPCPDFLTPPLALPHVHAAPASQPEVQSGSKLARGDADSCADAKMLERWTFEYRQPEQGRQLSRAQLSRLDPSAIYKRMVQPNL